MIKCIGFCLTNLYRYRFEINFETHIIISESSPYAKTCKCLQRNGQLCNGMHNNIKECKRIQKNTKIWRWKKIKSMQKCKTSNIKNVRGKGIDNCHLVHQYLHIQYNQIAQMDKHLIKGAAYFLVHGQTKPNLLCYTLILAIGWLTIYNWSFYA